AGGGQRAGVGRAGQADEAGLDLDRMAGAAPEPEPGRASAGDDQQKEDPRRPGTGPVGIPLDAQGGEIAGRGADFVSHGPTSLAKRGALSINQSAGAGGKDPSSPPGSAGMTDLVVSRV